jgi:DNA adenine methylase
MYKNEMTDADHLELLDALDNHPGPVLLSGYECDLYNKRLKHWEKKTARAFAEGGRERQEVLWFNQTAAEEVFALRLF